jgi:hypothetical protein
MSSVSGKGRSESASQDEQIRRMREEYKKKEAELVRKHSEELRKVSGSNITEIDDLKSQHSAQLNNIREGTKEAISKRDAKYQKEIEDIKRLQAKQTERVLKENEQKLKAQREASEAEVKHANRSKSDRLSELSQKYNSQIEENSANLNRQLEEARSAQKKGLDGNREKLLGKHKEEITQVQDNSNERIAELRNDLRVTRANSTQKARHQEIAHARDKQSQSNSFMDEIRRREVAHNDIQGDTRRTYNQNLDDIRQKSAISETTRGEQFGDSLESLKANVSDRIEYREKRLEREVTDEKAKNIRDEEELKRSYNRRVDNLTREYQTKYEQLEKSRRSTVDEANRRTAEKMRTVRSGNDEAMGLNSKYYQQQLDQEGLKSRQEIKRLKNEGEMREGYQMSQADTRIKNIRDQSYENEMRLKERYSQNLNVMDKTNDEESRKARLELLKQKDDAVMNVHRQMQESDTEHQQKVNDLVTNYEKKIGALNDQFVREKRLRDNREKQLVETMKKSSEAEKAAMKVQYEEHNRQANTQHEKEMREVTRRHKEQIDNIMATIKKS